MIFWLYLQTIWRRVLNKVYFNELCYFHYHSYDNCNEEITFFYFSNTSVNTYSTLWSLRNFICSLQPFTPSASRCISSILFFVYFLWYWWGDCSNSELLQFGFISFYLMTLMFDSVVILYGEIICQSLLGVKGSLTALWAEIAW